MSDQGQGPVGDNTRKDPDEWVTGDEPMTGAQASYLRTLCQEANEPFVESLRGRPEVEVVGAAGGRWLVRAADHQRLCDALAATPRPPGRLRVSVDPPDA